MGESELEMNFLKGFICMLHVLIASIVSRSGIPRPQVLRLGVVPRPRVSRLEVPRLGVPNPDHCTVCLNTESCIYSENLYNILRGFYNYI